MNCSHCAENVQRAISSVKGVERVEVSLSEGTATIVGSPNEPTSISFVGTDQLSGDGWYTLSGIKLDKRPRQSGVYILNGKKIVIK